MDYWLVDLMAALMAALMGWKSVELMEETKVVQKELQLDSKMVGMTVDLMDY